MSYQKKLYRHLLQNLCVLGFENSQTNVVAEYKMLLLQTTFELALGQVVLCGFGLR